MYSLLLLLLINFIASIYVFTAAYETRICSSVKEDLCFSVNVGENHLGDTIMLKSLPSFIQGNTTKDRMSWDILDDGSVILLNTTNNYIGINNSQATVSENPLQFDFNQTFGYNFTYMQIKNSKRCLYIAKCTKVNGNKFCKKDEKIPASNIKEIKHGSYIKSGLCKSEFNREHIAFQFIFNYQCSDGCDDSMLYNNVCDDSCNTKECGFDNNVCTPSPTLNPTTAVPTVEVTYINLTMGPTTSPIPDEINEPFTLAPSLVPTLTPTNSHTFNPSNSPTFNPSNSPTFTLSIRPTLNPSNIPTPNPSKKDQTLTPSPTNQPQTTEDSEELAIIKSILYRINILLAFTVLSFVGIMVLIFAFIALMSNKVDISWKT